jgi:hypothetical protein
VTTPAGNAATDPGTGTGGNGDNPTDPTANPTPPATTDPGASDPPKDLSKEVEKWKALSRQHEARSKENSKAATELAKIQDAQKSELQKAQDRADKAEAAQRESDALRFRLTAASQHGLSSDLVDYLGDGDQETITGRAETLVKSIETEVNKRVDTELAKYGIQRPAQGQPNGSAPTAQAAASLNLGGRPVESLRPGNTPTRQQPAASNNDLFRGLMGGQ